METPTETFEITVVPVIALGSDEWSRPCVRSIRTGREYVDINCGEGLPDWHTITNDDYREPLDRVRKHIVFEIVEPEAV